MPEFSGKASVMPNGPITLQRVYGVDDLNLACLWLQRQDRQERKQ